MLVIPFSEGFSNFIKEVKEKSNITFPREKQIYWQQSHYISTQKAACIILGKLFLIGTTSAEKKISVL